SPRERVASASEPGEGGAATIRLIERNSKHHTTRAPGFVRGPGGSPDRRPGERASPAAMGRAGGARPADSPGGSPPPCPVRQRFGAPVVPRRNAAAGSGAFAGGSG